MDYRKDYYGILEVNKLASPEQLRASYRRLAKLHHPDKNPGDKNAEERFKIINEAYEILSNDVTRHIYDTYRAEHDRKNKERAPTEDSDSVNLKKPDRKTAFKTHKVTREKRIYIYGSIEVKFQGEPELSAYANQWEQNFIIIPTEVLVTITESAIYRDGPPKEFQRCYSTADLFKTVLKQPISCKIITVIGEEYYDLEIYELRVKDPVLKDITKHEKCSFGTLEGAMFGYILHTYEEDITEEYTEFSGPTGQVETKTESDYLYIRQQFYSKEGSTYWDEWKRNPVYNNRRSSFRSRTQTHFRQKNSLDNWWWLILLIIIFVIWPPLLFVVLPMAGGLLLLLLLGVIISFFSRILPFIAAGLVLLIVALGVRTLVHSSTMISDVRVRSGFDSIATAKTVSSGTNQDTLLNHYIQWQDMDSNYYSINLLVPVSAVRRSAWIHENMDQDLFTSSGIGAVYNHLLVADEQSLSPVIAAFDSLAKVRKLDKQQTASMVVSCIQSLPYTLVVDRSCDAAYADDYINNYLAQCNNSDCCKGYLKFGVQSPIEFLGDLKGDCDTRSLLLYAILKKMAYNVALLTSNYYKHALIAVQIDTVENNTDVIVHIGEKSYYLWETTSKGFGPGKLPHSLSNINYWNISLIQ